MPRASWTFLKATPGGDVVVVPGGTGIGVPGGTGLPVAPNGKPGTTNRFTPPNAMKHIVFDA